MAPGMCHVRHASIALVASLCGGCSLVLDFDKPADPPPVDSAVTDESCMAFEPNESPAEAAAITPGDYTAAICGNGETDYYKITLDGTQSVLVRITFMNRNGAGDIDLRLLNSAGATTIDESRTSADVEEVMCPGGIMCNGPLPAGDYVVQVLGFNGAVTSAYTLHFETGAPMIDAAAVSP